MPFPSRARYRSIHSASAQCGDDKLTEMSDAALDRDSHFPAFSHRLPHTAKTTLGSGEGDSSSCGTSLPFKVYRIQDEAIICDFGGHYTVSHRPNHVIINRGEDRRRDLGSEIILYFSAYHRPTTEDHTF